MRRQKKRSPKIDQGRRANLVAAKHTDVKAAVLMVLLLTAASIISAFVQRQPNSTYAENGTKSDGGDRSETLSNSATSSSAGSKLLCQGFSLLDRAPDRAAAAALEVLTGHGNPHEQALDLLSACFENQCQSVQTPLQEAALRRKQIEQYQLVADHHRQWPELLYRKASLRLVLQRLVASETEQIHLAIRELEQVIKLCDQAGDEDAVCGGYFQLGRAEKHYADTLVEQALSSEADPWYRQALASLRECLKRDPQRVDALGEIVLIFVSKRQFNDAIAEIIHNQQRKTSQTVSGKMEEMLGALYAQTNQFEKAEAALRRAVQQNPKLVGASLHLANLYRKKQGREPAIECLARCLEHEAGFLNGYLQSAKWCVENKQFDRAAVLCEQMLEIPPSRAVVIGMRPSRTLYRKRLYFQGAAMLAWLHLEAGELDLAIQATQRAMSYLPPDAHLLDTLGSIFLAKGDHSQAVSYFYRAIDLADLPAAHFHLAQLYVSRSQLTRARQHVNAAVASDQPFYERAQALKLKQQLSIHEPSG